MANRYRLWQRLVTRSGWVRRFFALEDWLLVPIMKMPPAFPLQRGMWRLTIAA
jgi:hypothetical protein